MKKRFFSLVLALMLALSLLPMAALADETPTSQGSGTEADPWILTKEILDSKFAATFGGGSYYELTDTGTYRLAEDITVTNSIDICNAVVTLDLNGHELKSTNSTALLSVSQNRTGSTVSLTLVDSSENKTGKISAYYAVYIVSNCSFDGGDVPIYGTVSSTGTITGGVFYGEVTGGGTISGGLFKTLPSGRETWTVKFKPENDGEDMEYKAVKNTGIARIAAPVKAGFTFVDWYEKDANGAFKETAFDFDTAITADITLYAKWVCAGAHTGGTATCQAKAECSVCGEEYGDIDAANHTALNHVEPKAATTEAEGNIEYWCCGDCGKCFSDKGGETEIALADTVLAKLAPTPTPAPTATPTPTPTPAPTAKPQAPNTGDEASVALWLALATVSMACVALVGRKKVR